MCGEVSSLEKIIDQGVIFFLSINCANSNKLLVTRAKTLTERQNYRRIHGFSF